MSMVEYLKEKAVYIISTMSAIVLAVIIIWFLNPAVGPAISMLIGFLYITGTSVPLVIEYISKRDFYRNLLSIFDSLDRKNLIAEMITPPSFREGIILYDVLRGSNKAMLEEINKYKHMQEEYREYIELWVHEIKTPIASSMLTAQNNMSNAMARIYDELARIESFVEQVLFYSRSNNVEKDYIINKINLKNLCFNVFKKNSKLFIQNKIGVETENLDVIVLSDAKWLEFILNQILTNSVKYSDKPNACIKISAQKNENNVVLSIEDNGVGIKQSELPKIFDKGFTGTNGRKNQRSTGIGLYICKKLCDKLGLAVSAYSRLNEGTTINITFPKSSMVNIR